MQLQDIYIYPIKSLGGIRRIEETALQRGFKLDRRWMLVDETGKFITQRNEHKLSLLKTEISPDKIFIYNKAVPEQNTEVLINQSSTNTIKISIWDDTATAIHLNEKLDLWFSNYLDKPCKLVFMPENGSRAVDVRYAMNNEQVSFADTFPYLLISQASLNDLNSRLSEPVGMDRFRPNLVISGTKAFEEDLWSEIKIGEVYFKVAKPCSRCILTTIDQQTGIAGKEPLYTLSKYRTINNKVMFGQNLIALNEGNMSVNDTIEIISYK